MISLLTKRHFLCLSCSISSVPFSVLFGIGKKTVYKILKQNTTKYKTLTNLASSDIDTCVEAGRLLVADLYDPKGSAKSVHRDLNKLRVKLALSKDFLSCQTSPI